ncbi:retrovirus-related pol polyprotein from transposon TNT 1-94 [Tanacetum coccineum]
MDVKSAFLYRKIEEEVYVCQPPGFEYPDFPDRVYKVEKHYMDYIKLLELGELTFLLGLQVQQKKDGIFISQDKYVDEILKKFRSMIGSLMYLTSSRPDIMFAMCACARYQVKPKVSHLYVVKRIFRYLNVQLKLGLWYLKDSPFDLVAYTDSDYAGASLDKKSTTEGKAKKSIRLIIGELCKNRQSDLERKRIKRSVDGKKIIIIESTVKRDLQLEDADGVDCLPNATIFEQLALIGVPSNNDVDEAVYKELDDSLVRAATTASSLEKEQDSGNIIKTRSKATPNEADVSKLSNDPLLARYNTLRNGEDSLKLNELIKLCTNLKQRVLDLEKTKITQAEEIFSLKRRVKKREQKKRSRTHGLKRFYKVGLTTRVESSGDEESLGEDASKQGRINAIDADEDITLVNDQDDADMFDVNTLTALAALKSVKPKVKSNVIEDPSISVSDVSASTKVSAATTTTATILILRKGIIIDELGTSTTTTISSQTSQAKVQDKGKGILVEEPVKPKKKDRIRLDEEIASKLQAEFDEEERLAREKDKANVVLIEEWDDI